MAGDTYRAFLAAAVAAVALSAGACDTGSTTHCTAGAALEKSAHLARALAEYADAARVDEGDCAEEGTARVSGHRAEALRAVARAQAAERAGDPGSARKAYLSAWTTDRDNATAAAGLVRLTEHPADVDPVWAGAQRLADEGYDEEARAEVVAVLKAHPDQVVPRSLQTLRRTPPPSAPPTARAAAPPPRGGPGWTWPDTLIVLVVAGFAGVVGYLLARLDRRSTIATADQSRALAASGTKIERLGLRVADEENRARTADAELRAEFTGLRQENRRLARGVNALIRSARQSGAEGGPSHVRYLRSETDDEDGAQ
ncbi:hypothetical protein [Cryptosporangium arvum]|uniref:hypothetical protein n=1 Tax=Cryptosporangium arvum TaxID=80871 RepID=UPI0012ED5E3B|nr:hypothetical protein [Cryptosporangium arvum]